jgi:hypothetical protein
LRGGEERLRLRSTHTVAASFSDRMARICASRDGADAPVAAAADASLRPPRTAAARARAEGAREPWRGAAARRSAAREARPSMARDGELEDDR